MTVLEYVWGSQLPEKSHMGTWKTYKLCSEKSDLMKVFELLAVRQRWWPMLLKISFWSWRKLDLSQLLFSWQKQTCLSFLSFSFLRHYLYCQPLFMAKGHGIHDLLILKFFHFYLVSTHHQCLHHSKLGYANKVSVQGWIIPCCTRRTGCLTSLCTGAFIGEIW